MEFKVKKGDISASRECSNWVAYCNFETGEIFIHQFSDCNSWTNFDNDNIRMISKGTGKYALYGASNPTIKELISAAEDYLQNKSRAPMPVEETAC